MWFGGDRVLCLYCLRCLYCLHAPFVVRGLSINSVTCLSVCLCVCLPLCGNVVMHATGGAFALACVLVTRNSNQRAITQSRNHATTPKASTCSVTVHLLLLWIVTIDDSSCVICIDVMATSCFPVFVHNAINSIVVMYCIVLSIVQQQFCLVLSCIIDNSIPYQHVLSEMRLLLVPSSSLSLCPSRAHTDASRRLSCCAVCCAVVQYSTCSLETHLTGCTRHYY